MTKILNVQTPITDWADFTPTWNNFTLGTGGSSAGKYRRVGDSIEIQAGFVLGTGGSISGIVGLAISSFGGLSADTGKMININSQNALAVGAGEYSDSSAANGNTALTATYSNTRSQIEFGSPFGLVTLNAPITWAVGDMLSFAATIPISQYSTSNQMGDRQLEEYAWNFGSAIGADDSTSFGYGMAGTSFISFTPASGGYYGRMIKLTTPINASDYIDVFYIKNGLPQRLMNDYPAMNDGANVYGCYISAINSTDIMVYFGKSGADAATPWNSTLGKWFLKRVASGGMVGYPISGRNVIPETTVQRIYTTTTTISPGIGLVIANSATPFTLNLVTAVGADGKIISIKNINSATVTVDANGSELIDGQTTLSLDQYEAAELVAYNGNWYII
jgi:hypothetical protein